MLVLLVEPDELLADLLVFLLRRDGHDVLSARDEASARTRIAAKAPRLVIAEVALPQGSGWSLCQLVAADGETAVILLGDSAAEEHLVRALELGAEAYLPKPLSLRLVRAQVQAALRRASQRQGTSRGSGQPLQAGDLVLDPQWRQVRRGPQSVRLTATEFKLLQELALHEGQVLPHQTLVDRVWGLEAVDIGEDAALLKGHIRNLRRKLGEDSDQPSYIQTVPGVGYSFRPQGSAGTPARAAPVEEHRVALTLGA